MWNRGLVGYPSDVNDEEWAFVAPYLALCREDAPQRSHSLRAVFNGLRYIVKSGLPWRMMPHDLPPWRVVYHQTQRWIRAGCFETMVEDLGSLLRELAGRSARPTAMILDSRTLQSTPESGRTRGIRWGQAQEGIEGSCGGRYAGPSAGLACNRRRSTGPCAGGAAGRRGAADHRKERGTCLCGPGLYGRSRR